MSTPEPKKLADYDMFDVARGTCKFEDYLLTRFTEQELEKKIQIDPQASLQEQIAPPKPPPAPKPLFPPTTPAAATPPAQAQAKQGPAGGPEVPPTDPVDIQKLIAGFHQAAQDYTKRAHWESADEPQAEPKTEI